MRIAIFVVNIFICGSYSRAATISANSQSLRRLFEDGYDLKYGIYSKKYDILATAVYQGGYPGDSRSVYHSHLILTQAYHQFIVKVNSSICSVICTLIERCKASCHYVCPQYAAYGISNDQLHAILYCATTLSQLPLHVDIVHILKYIYIINDINIYICN